MTTNMTDDQIHELQLKVGEIIIQESCVKYSGRSKVSRNDHLELLELHRELMGYVRRHNIRHDVVDIIFKLCREKVKDHTFKFC